MPRINRGERKESVISLVTVSGDEGVGLGLFFSVARGIITKVARELTPRRTGLIHQVGESGRTANLYREVDCHCHRRCHTWGCATCQFFNTLAAPFDSLHLRRSQRCGISFGVRSGGLQRNCGSRTTSHSGGDPARSLQRAAMPPESTATVDQGEKVSSNENVETILQFWFSDDAKADGQGQIEAEAQPQCGGANLDKFFVKKWFMGGPAVDQVIIRRFAALHEKARKEELSSWEDNPRSTLALLLLLDQFSRNIYRGTAQAFDQDDLALDVTKRGGNLRGGTGIGPVGMVPDATGCPLADIKNQNLAVEYAKKMVEECPADLKSNCQGFLAFAEKHKVVIERFGRFPHRNVILGREATADETEFLKEPGSSFG
ncbi:hypothetical protein CBR_g2838 [Chara braunii]|uniref:DUF924 domain-containing protein n=1 Tax=Chara braunii TaxID=69332 RepID=A0A388KE07_CHABU|nr:hypothetical protein CBR_g2838 [Chara braunii]|eukprot:GBG68292.1 hypothetical protein CBR_g2838 [Chara braunii]